MCKEDKEFLFNVFNYFEREVRMADPYMMLPGSKS
jgi:hypothetical protein